MSSRVTKVQAHLRKGRAVVAHDRTVAAEADKSSEQVDTEGLTSGVSKLAGVSVVGQTFGQQTIAHLRYLAPGLRNAPDTVENCVFENVSFMSASFDGVEVVGCTFKNCSFPNVNLSGAKFVDCVFQDTDVSSPVQLDLDMDDKDRAKYSESPVFERCQFERGDFHRVFMRDGRFSGCDFRSFRVGGPTRWHDMSVVDCRFSDTLFQLTDLSGSRFTNCRFDASKFQSIGRQQEGEFHNVTVVDGESAPLQFHSCEFVGTEIMGGNLSDSELTDCRLVGSIISHVTAKKMDVSGTTFEAARIASSDFYSSTFAGATLRDVTFDQTLLNGVAWTDASVLDVNVVEPVYELSHYHQYGLEDALVQSGLSETQFEYLVTARVIEVRDNKTLQKVTSGFDITKHHVPPWAYDNIKNLRSKLAGE